MAKIPKMDSLNSLMDSGNILQEQRSYLGYSGLGDPCSRKLWYNFRWVKDRYITPRIARIFERGNIEEDRILEDLKQKGVTIVSTQKEMVDATGHARGHSDAEIINVPFAEKTVHLFECKTMKNSKYKEYLSKGLKAFSPAYWQQIHSYMGHQKNTRCLYVVTNKDNEERDYKRIPFDEDVFKEGEKKAFYIITSSKPPAKLPGSGYTWFACKFCDYKSICHRGDPVKKSCRTCTHWDIEVNGHFSCSLHDVRLNDYEQLSMNVCSGSSYKLAEEYK